jgi:hypothetical protein
VEVNNMKKKALEEKFHGMVVVSDEDSVTVRGKTVVEINSAGNLVGRDYDRLGNAKDESYEFDLGSICKPNSTESNITGSIKRALGQNGILISESAADLIKDLAE